MKSSLSRKTVALLYGGSSPERDISLLTKEVVEASIVRLGHGVLPIDVADISAARTIPTLKCDLAFMAMHGHNGENGCIQGMLEMSGIPYTHSGVLASSICIDKPAAKLFFKGLGANVAYSRLVTREEILQRKVLYPKKYVLKPTNEGSSRNIVVVDGESHLTEQNYPFDGPVMLEEFISGYELSVAFLSGRVLGGLELELNGSEYCSYDAKYKKGFAEWVPIKNIPDEVYQSALTLTENICNILHCRGAVRADFKYDDKESKLVILEVNTCPGMTILPKIAKACANMEIDQVVQEIMEDVDYGVAAMESLHVQ
ncbi:D-ala D-ala ligase family protein [Neorickettsia helminthoeca str. Oregon]|uniref:D-alanine--D-alanine ligase n=1 Tax=Neorickettsia helminthoeca str. Oregon TaxID=1286528 RepID=X5H4B6_9RICK|nr:D-alanine--D-alanine ligase [Neorickettsia helminthoeca]AHX11503.1 D-ala D-ala ligase family protein [Neorickettsia helminthoeca str. Oregon]